MASAFPFSENEPFSQQVKCLADEELLEIWDESQHIENLIFPGLSQNSGFITDYEQTIVVELFLRASRKLCKPDAKSRPGNY